MNPLYLLELRIAKLLRYGVLLAGGLILIGWIGMDPFGPNPFTRFQVYDSVALLPSVRNYYLEGAWAPLTCYAGLLVLVCLPGIRVLLTVVLFLKQREYLMAGIAAFVFGMLLLSFSLGFEI